MFNSVCFWLRTHFFLQPFFILLCTFFEKRRRDKNGSKQSAPKHAVQVLKGAESHMFIMVLEDIRTIWTICVVHLGECGVNTFRYLTET